MIRWHSSSRRRSDRAASTRLLRSWPGRLALLVIALGLVLMHHVVGAHQHSAADTTLSAASTHAVGHGAGAEHQDAPDTTAHVGAGAHPVNHGASADALPPGSAALLHQHPDENGHDHAGSLLHVCLVALVGAAVFLLVLVLVALWWRPPSSRLHPEGSAPATVPRAPPSSSRLAELQVLRL